MDGNSTLLSLDVIARDAISLPGLPMIWKSSASFSSLSLAISYSLRYSLEIMLRHSFLAATVGAFLFTSVLGSSADIHSVVRRQNQIVFPPANGPCPQNRGQTPCMFSLQSLSMINVLTNFQFLVLPVIVSIFLHQVSATFRHSKASQFVDVAQMTRYSAPHVEVMLVVVL
jgi:hypothetical protein